MKGKAEHQGDPLALASGKEIHNVTVDGENDEQTPTAEAFFEKQAVVHVPT